jgi:hypothetical protein
MKEHHFRLSAPILFALTVHNSIRNKKSAMAKKCLFYQRFLEVVQNVAFEV